MASIVAFREYVRLEPADRAAVEVRRKALLDRFESIVAEGVAEGSFEVDDPREAARAIVTLSSSLVAVFSETDEDLDAVITRYRRYCLRIVGA